PEAARRLEAALAEPPERRRDAVSGVVATFPRFLEGWASLGELARDDVEAYACFRVGYHRGLDALRQAGWRGSGYVRWAHEHNRGFLRALDGLRQAAAAIGEADEEERCRQFLRQLDPTGGPPPADREARRGPYARMVASPPEREVTALARRIAELGAGEKARVYNLSWWSERMLGWAMAHPSFKTQLFRFVDVFPATGDDADVLRHIDEYFESADAPRVMELGIDLAERLPLGDRLSAGVARRNIERMAHQFIAGATPAEAVPVLHRLWRQGGAFTVDLLGEKTVTEADADRYAARVEELLEALVRGTASWAPDDHLERDDLGPLPRANLSIKPTALASLYAPLTRAEGLAQARRRLLPLLRLAAEHGAFVWFDMERYDVKDLTLELFRDLVATPELAGLQAGVVLQAYLKDSHRDLADLIAWASEPGPGGSRAHPIGVRLVKGAYWDSETITARAEGWPSPVYAHKAETDANFERCTRLLHDHHGTVRAAFGSHNLRSLAYAVTYAQASGIPDTGYEIQMLHGMAEPVQAAIRRLGLRLRIYAPVGELVPGMAYLVRRLLENTSNESFVRHRFAEGRRLDELIAPPSVERLPDRDPPARRPATDPADPGPYAHE
ncbi:MAG: proline dehydrogenase family protein, partial [Acidimicrobiales bacterium]